MIRFFLFAFTLHNTQSPATPEGRWTGTSICIQRNGPCHDERVVYYIERIGADSAGITRLSIDAKKIINGVEEDMGVLSPCKFTHSTGALYCPMPPNVAPGDWKFTVTDDKLDGGLWIPGGAKFRDVHLTRAKALDAEK